MNALYDSGHLNSIIFFLHEQNMTYVSSLILTSFLISAKSYPFRITFLSDAYEFAAAAINEVGSGKGFKLRYTLTSC